MATKGRKKNTYSIFKREDSDKGSEVEQADLRMDIELFKKSLSPKMAVIFQLLDDGYNQREIGEKLGCSQPTISRQVEEIKALTVEFFS